MKQKTSVSIEETILAVLKREAKRQDRSVSYILEKFLEEKAQQLGMTESGIRKKRRPRSLPHSRMANGTLR